MTVPMTAPVLNQVLGLVPVPAPDQALELVPAPDQVLGLVPAPDQVSQTMVSAALLPALMMESVVL